VSADAGEFVKRDELGAGVEFGSVGGDFGSGFGGGSGGGPSGFGLGSKVHASSPSTVM
jgi:hypothetical protein